MTAYEVYKNAMELNLVISESDFSNEKYREGWYNRTDNILGIFLMAFMVICLLML